MEKTLLTERTFYWMIFIWLTFLINYDSLSKRYIYIVFIAKTFYNFDIICMIIIITF